METSQVIDRDIPIEHDTIKEVKETTFQANNEEEVTEITKTETAFQVNNVEEVTEITRTETLRNSNGVISLVVQVLLRSLTALCMTGAVITMLFFTEQTTSFGITASYRSSSALKFFVWGSGIAGMYCILSLAFVFCSPRNRFLHSLDMTMMALAMAAFSAAASIGHIAFFGDESIGWGKVCNYVERFCNRSIIALCSSFIGFAVLFFVCILSSP